jgi:hypothetical protein
VRLKGIGAGTALEDINDLQPEPLCSLKTQVIKGPESI